jgi:vitamin B12 transporter
VRGFYSAFSVPAHTYTFTANQEIGRRTSVNLDLYRSSLYYNPLSAAGRPRAYRYPGITKADFVVSRQINRSEKHPMRLYVKVDNMFNQEYYENGFLVPRATWLGGLQVMFR